ncbi:alpha-2-macroglobulin family protein [Treponema sp.]|uniref:alpha-2-macroglobulin family protein n=1 Tax=Treponema sp. TaxID=166 RepID=UPI003EFBE49C
MKNFKLYFVILASACIFFSGCKKENQNSITAEDEILIEEISPTFIGRMSDISLRFACEPECNIENAFSLSPRQKGEWKFSEDKRTVSFCPEKPYKANSKITLKADFSKLFPSKNKNGIFTREFITTDSSFKVGFNEIMLDDDGNYSLSGVFETDIPVEEKKVSSALKASVRESFKSRKLDVSWLTAGKSTSHSFSITGIRPSDKQQTLLVEWNGKKTGVLSSKGAQAKDSKKFTIPASGIFDIIDINTSRKNSITVSFSQFISTSQNLLGFIKAFDEQENLVKFTNATVKKNILTIFSDTGFENISSLKIASGLKSESGILLASTSSISIAEHWELPSVKFTNSGNILPTSQGTVLSVMTRNLDGLLIQAFRIPDHNMIQFLQVNNLDEKKEMYRVGEPVWEKRVSLPWNSSMQNCYVPRGIDISELTKKYPGGMFQIRISFRKRDIKYVCPKQHPDFSNIEMPRDTFEEQTEENSYWDYLNNMDYETRRTFWNYDDDPCHPAFYMELYNPKNTIKRNIIVSDIGLMAKKETSGKIFVTAADIRTAQPYKNIRVEIFNFIGKSLGSAKTDSNGNAVFDCQDAVFITATAADQTSYLKLSGGTTLSISHFETGGIKSADGLKGFIYGERGIWRPGDNMFLTFVLQDSGKTLPEDIPVTFELINPRGKTVETKILQNHKNGFYPIDTKTQEDGETGVYTAKIKIGGNEWTKPLRVESIVPNKLSVKLMPASGKILSSGKNEFRMEGEWLHGASAAGYKADVSVMFSKQDAGFKGYENYTFTNPRNTVESRREKIWEGTLDSNSKANFNVDLDAGWDLPGLLKANMTSRIFEPSGAFSTEYTSFTFSPYKRYVGLKLPKGDAARNMLLTDKQHTADIVLVDENGNPVNEAKISYSIYKINWKWWWEKDAYSEAGFTGRSSYSKIASGECDIKNGKGSFTFEVNYPSWGRYLVVAEDNRSAQCSHSAGKIVYIDWPGWASRAVEGENGSASMVSLSADKKSYIPGETASITFASGKSQRALATIEKNGTILKQEWIETEEGTTVYKTKIEETMAPNCYVHITLLQQHLQTANSLPVRLYGIVPLMVENPKTVLEPVISCADTFTPGKETVISIAEKNGRPMTYTVAVVDEGLLGLTNFHVPDIHSEFYKKEASQLENWDIYSYVINAYSGKLETILAVGGGDEINTNAMNNSNRFAPVVKYFGPYTISQGEKKALSFKMPQYIGAVKIMAVAGNNDSPGIFSCGSSEKSVKVKSSLMVQPVIPRTLGADEKISLPVVVFNGTENDTAADIAVKVSGAASLAETRTVKIPAMGNITERFTLKTNEPGDAVFEVSANSKSGSAHNKESVKILSRGIPAAYRKTVIIKPGKTEKIEVESPLEKGTGKLSLEVSTIPSLNLESRLSYLLNYPHGCIEQITSGAFPQLYLPSFAKLNEQQIEQAKENIKSVIKRYSLYQKPNGGFSYWQGGEQINEWGTCYAAHFLSEAKKNGYTVPAQMYKSLMDYLDEKASFWNGNSREEKEIHAYAVFVLALAGRSNIGAMNRLDSFNEMSNTAQLLLSCAYSLSGNTAHAEKIRRKADRNSEFFRMTGGNFSSSHREEAMKLFAAVLSKNTSAALKQAKTVSGTLDSEEWLSTQETAWSLLALLPYYTSTQKNEQENYSIERNGKTASCSIEKISDIRELDFYEGNTQLLSITNKGSKDIFAVLTVSGNSKAGNETARNDGIRLKIKYTDESGKKINPASTKTGDSILMNISVDSDMEKEIKNMALAVPIPTCWEISNDRISLGTEMGKDDFTYQDIRDNLVCTYFDLEPGQTKKFSILATVVFEGEYFIPAVSAEAMYDNSIGAIVPGVYAVSSK